MEFGFPYVGLKMRKALWPLAKTYIDSEYFKPDSVYIRHKAKLNKDDLLAIFKF